MTVAPDLLRDNSSAREVYALSVRSYLQHGWALCRIPAGKKGPESKGWNLEANAIRDPAALSEWIGNIGLLHAWSGTCALDIDKYQEAHGWLASRGVDLDQLMAADDAVQIVSGRAGSAKLLYRLPAGVGPLLTLQIKDPHADPKDRGKSTWLELRCASAAGQTVQDVLPPSIHPGTGKAYCWAGSGDWRALPELPASLLKLWLALCDESPKQRQARGATGPGTSPEVIDMVRRVHSMGLKPYRSGDGFRSFCPVHGGESGTTFKIDEAADGRALIFCHNGCSHDALFKALPPPDHAVPRNVTTSQQLRAAQDARKGTAGNDAPLILPDFPNELLALPHGLGYLQAWILGFMTYPSPAMAGFTAWAVLAHFAMRSVRIDSRRGLGVNEQFLLLAPTGFGKEDLRAPFEILGKALLDHPKPSGAGHLWLSGLPVLQHSAPASQQGLHRILENSRGASTFLADEFAEWLGHTASDSHKQQALQHIMQAYGRAFGTLAAPAAVTTEYKPVEHPRVLIFATSTAERILETITSSQADSGALNRFVVMVGEQGLVEKRYGVTGADFKPPARLVDLIAWIVALPVDTHVSLAPEARALYEQHDAAVLDPLKFRDPRLAGRLNEQAFKLAALIALSDRRVVIQKGDLQTAYAVREGLYRRAASLIGYDGALSGMHATGRALEQLRQHFERKAGIYRSDLRKVSRQFARLSIPEQDAVMRALQSEGIARLEGARLVSLIHQEAAA